MPSCRTAANPAATASSALPTAMAPVPAGGRRGCKAAAGFEGARTPKSRRSHSLDRNRTVALKIGLLVPFREIGRMDGARAAAIEVVGLRAGYGTIVVVNGVDLSVAPGEFVAILGSSGCGKTTLLRTIAGFQTAFAGRVRSFGRDMTDLPPERRDVAMVFQSYALWPHMTVLGNIGYGLRLRGLPRAQIRTRVAGVLALLSMAGLEDRKVTDLSGGQRQRVALGRALAIDPRLLLLDEPLSNLDAKVRIELRHELRALQRRIGI